MKTKQTKCILLAVLSLTAMICGGVGLYRGEETRLNETAYAEANLSKAQNLLALSQKLGEAQTVYTAAGRPVRSAYDDPMFTQDLYARVDAYQDENQLYEGIAALAALPEMRDAVGSGASYESICRAAEAIYSDQLSQVQSGAGMWKALCIVLNAAGLAGVIDLIVRLSAPESTAQPVSTRKPPEQPARHQHRLALHHS